MKFSSLAILFLFALMERSDVTEAFSSSIVLTTKKATSFVKESRNNNDNDYHKLSAVVYGWDDEWDNEDGDDGSTMTSTASSSYSLFETDYGSCPVDGAAVAESLTSDESRVAALARLAAAFSPPERGIAIKDIERVEVVCVHDDRIELEAMLCESIGCVSLSVPITFPNSCSIDDDDDTDGFVGCVNRNIEVLDIRAETTLAQVTSFGGSAIETYDLNNLSRLDESVEYPHWWLPSIRYGKAIETECDHVRVVLNDREFSTCLVALAQDTLDNANNNAAVLENAAAAVANGVAADSAPGGINRFIEPPEKLTVKRAKVAAVGPAGICFKVAAMYEYQKGLKILDVVYPFPDKLTPVTDVETLRSIVLGAVVEAEV